MSQWKFADNSDSDQKPADSSAPPTSPDVAPEETSTSSATVTPAVAAPSPTPVAPIVPAPVSSAAPFQFQLTDEPTAPLPSTLKKATSAPAAPPQPTPSSAPQTGVPTANAASSAAPTAPPARAPFPAPPLGGSAPPVPPAGVSPTGMPPTGVPSPMAPRGGVPGAGTPNAVPTPQVPVPSPAIPAPSVPPGAARPTPPQSVGAPGNTQSGVQPNAPRPPASAPSVPTPTPPAPVPSPTYGATPTPSASNTGVPQIAQPKMPVADEKMSAWQGREMLEKISPFASWLFRICMCLFLFALVYVVFGLLSSGKLIGDASATLGTAPTNNGDANAITAFKATQVAQQDSIAQLKTLVTNAHTASMVLTWALVGIALSLVVLAFDLGAIGVIVAGLGAVLLFLAPPGIFGMFGKNLVTASVINGLIAPPALMTVIAIGMLKLVADVFIFFTTVPDKMRSRASVGVPQPADAKQRLKAQNANMFSPCWELPFCREVVKKQCPAFLAKKRCWKFGRGCYCDEEMISRIIRGESLEIIKSPTRMSRQGKPPCAKCHIYLEHQRHKFRWLSPLSIPGTIAMMFFGWPVYLTAFALFWKVVSPLFAAVSFDSAGVSAKMGFDPTGADRNFNQISPEQMEQITRNGLAIIVGILALIYISKAVETIIYKLNW